MSLERKQYRGDLTDMYQSEYQNGKELFEIPTYIYIVLFTYIHHIDDINIEQYNIIK